MSLKRWRKGAPTGSRNEKRALADLEKHTAELAAAEETENAKDIATALNNIGTAYADLQDYPKAREYYERAVGALTADCDGEDYSTSHGNAATICRLLEDWPAAIRYAMLAEAYSRKLDYPDDIDYLAIAMGLVRKSVGLEKFRELFQAELDNLDEDLRAHVDADRHTHPTFEKKEKEPGRNDPCPCGSGKKYKKCCGAGN